MKGIFEKLKISESTKASLEKQLGKDIVEKFDSISSHEDLKAAISESMRKVPIKTIMGVAIGTNIIDLSKTVKGKDYDIADDIAKEITEAIVSQKERIDPIYDRLVSLGFSQEQLVSAQENIEKALENFSAESSRDDVIDAVRQAVSDPRRNSLKGQSKADIREFVKQITELSGDIVNELEKGFEKSVAEDNLIDSIKKHFEKQEFASDESALMIANAAEREEEVISLLKTALTLGKDQLDELMRHSRLLITNSATNVAGGFIGAGPGLGGLGALGALGGMLKGSKSLASLGGFMKGFAKLGGPLALAFDALEGIADPKLAKNSIASRGIASAITGGSNATVTGNAMKGAMLGATIGSIIPVVGTALGTLVGGALGAAASYIDTKWLADQIDSALGWIGDIFSPDKWLGPEGYLSVLWNLPATMDQWGNDIFNSLKEMMDSAISALIPDYIEDLMSNSPEAQAAAKAIDKANGISFGGDSSRLDANGNVKHFIPASGLNIIPNSTPATQATESLAASIREKTKSEAMQGKGSGIGNFVNSNTLNSGNVSNIQINNRNSAGIDRSHAAIQAMSFGRF